MVNGMNILRLSFKKVRNSFSLNFTLLKGSQINLTIKYLKKEYVRITQKSPSTTNKIEYIQKLPQISLFQNLFDGIWIFKPIISS